MRKVLFTMVFLIILAPIYSQAGTFTAGNCTWGVSQIKGGIPWSGHAFEWYSNAKKAGYPVGLTPKKGAIVVFPGGKENRASNVGHVGVVVSEDRDVKNPVMKSMNDVAGFNKWTTRGVYEYANRQNRVKPIGYIYYKLDKI